MPGVRVSQMGQPDPVRSEPREPSFCRGFQAVLGKHALLKKRAWKGLVAELVLPAVIFVGLIGVWKAVGTDDKPDEEYLSRIRTNDFFYGRWMPDTWAGLANDSCMAYYPPLCAASADERLPAGLPNCTGEYRADACVGQLCLRLTEDTPRNCTAMALLPFTYRSLGFGEAAMVDVPDLDVVAVLRHYVSGHIDGDVEDMLGDAATTGDQVAVVAGEGVAPDDDRVEALRQHLRESTYTWRELELDFDTEAEAINYAKKDGSQKVWLVLTIRPLDQGEWVYDLRMNDTSVPETKSENQLFVSRGLSREYEKYLTGGFISVQRLVDNYILNGTAGWTAGSGDAALADAVVAAMPVKAYQENSFLATVGDFIPFFMAIVLMYPVSQLIAAIVREKEQRIREVMLVMGLSPAVLRLSWIVFYFTQMALTGLLAAFVLKVSYMSNSDFFILLLTLVLYFVSVVSLAIMIAAFFSKAQLAAIAGPILFFGTVIIGSVISDDVSLGTKKMVSIFSTYPFTQIMKLAGNYESSGIGIKWEYASEDEYSLNTGLGFLVFDILLYNFVAWYVENVLPQEHGTPKKPWFLFMPSYWIPSRTHSGFQRYTKESRTSRAEAADMVEPITDPELLAKESVRIRGLRKTFKKADGERLVAVNNLSLSFYEGQIQVLLGHNGAGKTTAINMLTGMIPIDGGDAEVYGLSARDQMELIRTQIGLCPQHNVLWGNMTCEEHLRFFAKVKGVPAAEIEDAVTAALERVELADKRKVWSDALSGGMKRKLSVAIALVGDSKFVIFDEPTAGMDVEARRAIWDLMKESKKDRTVLLTTHFMDEADLLGDSIAIMHRGRLHCWGSSLFLKSRLGVGYSLKIDFRGRDATRVTEVMRRHCGPKVELLSAAGSELIYRLPTSATSQFSALFRTLEEEGAALGIGEFGVSETTLEEIFLKIASDDETQDESDTDEASEGPGEKTSLLGSPAGRSAGQPPVGYSVRQEDLLQGTQLHWSQWRGLMRKRFNYYKRDRKTLCCQTLLPIVLITIACAIDQVPVSDPPALTLDGYEDAKPSSVPVAPSNSTFQQFLRRDRYAVESVDAGSAANLSHWLLREAFAHDGIDRWQAVHSTQAEATLFHNSSEKHSLAIATNAISATRLASGLGSQSPKAIHARNYPLPMSDWAKQKAEGIQTVSKTSMIYAPFTFVPAVFVGFLVMERARKAKLVQMVSGVRRTAYWSSNLVFDYALFMVTIALGLLTLAAFGRDEYVSGANFFATLSILMLYGFAAIGLSYFASFYFESHTSAQNVMKVVNFMPALLLLTMVTILQLVPSTTDVGKALSWVCKLLPSYCLGEALQNLAAKELYSSLGDGETGPFAVCNGPGCSGVGTQVIVLLVQIPIIYAMVLLKECPHLFRRYASEPADAIHEDDQDDDCDVAKERAEVESGSRADDLVVVRGLCKEFAARGGAAKKKAVRNLSFAVHSEEIFAFLGTNGAGKTTTMSMMSGEFPPTAGTVTINGFDILEDPQSARQQLGYCPQFDALLDLLTPQETIEFYCALRGVPEEQRKRVTDALVAVLDLKRHKDKICKSLSGGNKRKASIAISLVGGPAVVLLDEPTAGMDPAARRRLWTALQRIGSGRSVVLTTHHLEEVEALAHRVTIMVAGKLECMGSLNHLKSKFGGGYQLEMKVSQKPSEAIDFVTSRFAGAALVERQGMRMTFRLGAVKLSEVFGEIEQQISRLHIVDYSIAQTSLEQVFMAICKEHMHGDAAGDAAAVTPLQDVEGGLYPAVPTPSG
eukprot:TRINITY_DN137_c0_g1_i12.p1 TRINITY_DN137_c0_g1~~TRINITY_DN137_c0_g1_i12.p1  ORF type:complete len:1800 (+),score=711.39 TRINITY_DN137_c0_g1_i12:86-5401(+)